MYNPHHVLLLVLGTAQMVLVASTLTYTQKSSPLRHVTLTLLAGLGYSSYWSCSKLSTSSLWNGTCAAMIVVYCLHHIDLLLIKKVERADLIDTTQPRQGGGFFRALNLAFSTRCVSSKWQISNLTAVPSYFENRKDPGRLSYLFRTTIIFAWQYLVLDLVDAQVAGQTAVEQEELYGDDQEFVFFNATKEQLGTRILTSVATSYLIARIIIDFVYRFMSLIAVGTGISKPKDWPPFFGRMGEAYTIRFLWGKFWHQWLRGPLAAVSTFVTRRILGLPRRSTLERYTNIFATFTLSAIVHVLNDIVAGKGVQIGTIMQFQVFALSLLMEDGAQELSRRFTGAEESAKSNGKTPAWRRYIGYVWVVVVLSIVVPWSVYPAGRMPTESMWVVPFSVVGALGVPTVGTAIAICSIVIIAFLKPEV